MEDDVLGDTRMDMLEVSSVQIINSAFRDEDSSTMIGRVFEIRQGNSYVGTVLGMGLS